MSWHLQLNSGRHCSTTMETLFRNRRESGGHHLRMVGRLKTGVSMLQARNDLARIAHTPVSEFPPSAVGVTGPRLHCELATQRPREWRETGASRHFWGGCSLVLLIAWRERDEPVAGSRRATARRIRHAGRAGRRAMATGPSAARGKFAAGHAGRRLRNDGGPVWGTRSGRS